MLASAKCGGAVAVDWIQACPNPAMSVAPDQYREALRLFPAGVTLVTIRAGEAIHGLTVSAFASVSPEPPLVAVIIDHKHTAHRLLEVAGAVFAVNVLREDQRDLSDRFAWMKDSDRFNAGAWTTAATGAPILADALVWLDCRMHSRLPAGTHTVYVGEVMACRVASPEAAPLLYWDRDYRQLLR
jgi:flavin reductase (DIM6/NTAB) family NADH-FMN oxidoreductase RutF